MADAERRIKRRMTLERVARALDVACPICGGQTRHPGRAARPEMQRIREDLSINGAYPLANAVHCDDCGRLSFMMCVPRESATEEIWHTDVVPHPSQ